MNAINHEFRTVLAKDLPVVSALLAKGGLSAEDLTASRLEYFEMAVDAQGRVVGLAGFDRCGADALLRSLAVAADWRDRGLGQQLVERREAAARRAGL